MANPRGRAMKGSFLEGFHPHRFSVHHRYEEVSTGESALKGMGNELRKLSTSALNGRKTLLLECLRDL